MNRIHSDDPSRPGRNRLAAPFLLAAAAVLTIAAVITAAVPNAAQLSLSSDKAVSTGGFAATRKVYYSYSLSAPSVKAASTSYSSIKVSWGAVSGASGYAVYRATSYSGTYS